MTPQTILAIVTVVIAALVGSGAVRFYINYGTRLALIEDKMKESQLMTLHPRVNRLEDAVQEIKAVVHKVHLLDTVNSKLDEVRAQLIPRREVELRFENIESEVETLKSTKKS
jgi:hypothetical protein